MTIVAGYLGAGKTTLINNTLRELDEASGLALLVNDFGELNIDAALLRGAIQDDDRIMSLQNGCICCALRDDLAQSLETLRNKGIDRIWMEASGVALPGKTKRQCQYPGYYPTLALVVVDATQYPKLSTDKYVGSLVQQQIAEADALVLRPDEEIAALADSGHASKIVPRTAVTELLSLGTQASPREEASNVDHLFASTVIDGTRWANLDELQAYLSDLPDFVHRVKGFVRIEQSTYVVHKNGAQIDIHHRDIDEEPRLVMIYPAACRDLL